MRIVYLSASSIPSRAANSIHVMRMCEAFARNGHETTLIGKQFGRSQPQNAYEFYGVAANFELALIPCKKIKGVGVFVLPKLYARLRKHDPREVIIYARDVYGASMAMRMGFRVIYEAHALPYNGLIRFLETSLLRSRRLLRLVVISEALKNLYVSRFDIRSETIVCHDAATPPNGTPPVDYPWPSSRNTLQIGYTGHLHQGRGIEVILECATRLPQYDFHVVGGEPKDVAFWKAQGAPNVYFHGFIEPSKVASVRRLCDVLVMPYQTNLLLPHCRVNTSSWMSPMKLFEYMASGKAIVASDLPVLREVLNEEMAILVSPGDTDAWGRAMQRCEDGHFREFLAKNARRAFLENYTWEQRAKKVLEGVDF